MDFRSCLYGLSDVIINRPTPLRVFDQIYMKLPDMLLQAELTAQWCDGKTVLFIGDGDAIALAMMHLSNQKRIKGQPKHATVLDFDERIVNSVNHFASKFGMTDKIHAELYNVADPLPEVHWGRYDAFYTNLNRPRPTESGRKPYPCSYRPFRYSVLAPIDLDILPA
jgi:N4-bis(aminopropyl)spermidine synthase